MRHGCCGSLELPVARRGRPPLCRNRSRWSLDGSSFAFPTPSTSVTPRVSTRICSRTFWRFDSTMRGATKYPAIRWRVIPLTACRSSVLVGSDTFFTDSTGRVEVAMPPAPIRAFVDETRLPIWRGQMPDRGYIQRLAFDTILIAPGSGAAEIPGTTVALAGARLLLAHPPDAPPEDWTPLDADILQIAADSTVRARKRTNRYGVATWKGSELPALGEMLAIGIDYDRERFRCVDAIHFDPLTISGKLVQHVCVRRDAAGASRFASPPRLRSR